MEAQTQIKKGSLEAAKVQVEKYLTETEKHLFFSKEYKKFFKVLHFTVGDEIKVFTLEFGGRLPIVREFGAMAFFHIHPNEIKGILKDTLFPNGYDKKHSIKNFKAAKNTIAELKKGISQMIKDEIPMNDIIKFSNKSLESFLFAEK